MVAVLAAVVLLAAAPARDRTPPVFAGLRSATTCLPGPSGGAGQKSRYRLSWKPARDDTTRRSRIVYDIYRATSRKGERFAHPTWTSRRGATSFTTPPLSSKHTYWFVVRARDRAGNRDRNRHEVEGVNLCE
jgi:hypothetical protein